MALIGGTLFNSIAGIAIAAGSVSGCMHASGFGAAGVFCANVLIVAIQGGTGLAFIVDARFNAIAEVGIVAVLIDRAHRLCDANAILTGLSRATRQVWLSTLLAGIRSPVAAECGIQALTEILIANISWGTGETWFPALFSLVGHCVSTKQIFLGKRQQKQPGICRQSLGRRKGKERGCGCECPPSSRRGLTSFLLGLFIFRLGVKGRNRKKDIQDKAGGDEKNQMLTHVVRRSTCL